ncbi:WXG100 family type VII secretion target [Nocardia huaxiensis]|uniref:WXG100 family type VII secretion target n=1 Tax=Nocardia huaxiensis TaxID=2755382 RepID=UPI001E5FA3E1|nr:WXG100 family type VII secretion target [Nocardia huaxiensis]UFS95474.1 WXG100 family type VII secretion target [Nocardia huaxiensis]
MATNDPTRISANFDAVEAGAQGIIAQARDIMTQLEALHKKVTDFVTNNWEGDANDAFAQMQGNWNNNVNQLNTTLESAGQLVSTGNADLQAKDTALAGLF